MLTNKQGFVLANYTQYIAEKYNIYISFKKKKVCDCELTIECSDELLQVLN